MVEIGGFHPILLPHYFSDYEYTLRARRLGFGLITSPDVWLCSYEELTGVRILKGGTRMDILRAIFSVKTIDNPIYWISFLLLSCPLRYLPANIVRVFRYTRLRIREARQAYAASQPDK
jgi:GT2 family glycosyltransferase